MRDRNDRLVRQHLSRNPTPQKLFGAGLVGVLFVMVLNVAFWLSIILGTLWGLNHFGVIG